MIIRIEKAALRLGMFIEAVECPGDEFAERRFLLDAPAELKRIATTSATTVLINTSLGATAEPVAIERGISIERKARERRLQAIAEKACSVVQRELANIAAGGNIDSDALRNVADGVAQVVGEAPDLFLKVTRLKHKDTVTFKHSLAVSALMMRVGQVMNLSDETISELGLAGLVHDIGKLRISDSVLKKEGKLDDSERKLIKQHPRIGYQILLAGPPVSELVLDVCLHHHELLDGSGYPDALAATSLPLHCRIAAVCDVFEALTSARPYKAAWSSTKALEWLYAHMHQYDVKIVGRLHDAILPRLVV